MKITIDHDTCQHGDNFADRCLAATIRHPLGHNRYCTEQVEDDGRPELTVVLIHDGQEHTLVLRNQTEVEAAALEGLEAFLPAAAARARAV
ncbi:MAG: hypothetical protein HY023_02725 [Chloroflexi bacterium]|nr:hypothetical protein [Chloroflexota bacterium]MBI3764353.1 hypothetical protein [Chloroflexota bacterium]